MYLENLINKVKLPFRKDKELYRRLYDILGFYPHNIAYYKQALAHKSLSIKSEDGKKQNNERLEFLGDAILDAIVGDIVYRHFEGKKEGFLTNTRSKIVQRESLGKIAVEVGLDKLIMSQNLHHTPHSYLAGNAFEALVGAIYLDYGYERCMEFMKQRILNRLVNIDKVAYKEVNFKSKLLEWSQKNRIRIVFDDREQRNENNSASIFHSEVLIEEISCGAGKGYSKKEAQQNAAKDALYQLKKNHRLEESVFSAKGKRTAMEEQPQALLPEIPEELLEPKKEKEKEKRNDPKPEKKKTAPRAEKKAEPKPEKKAEQKQNPKPEKSEESCPSPVAGEAVPSPEAPTTEESHDKPHRHRRHHRPSRKPKAEADASNPTNTVTDNNS